MSQKRKARHVPGFLFFDLQLVTGDAAWLTDEEVNLPGNECGAFILDVILSANSRASSRLLHLTG